MHILVYSPYETLPNVYSVVESRYSFFYISIIYKFEEQLQKFQLINWSNSRSVTSYFHLSLKQPFIIFGFGFFSLIFLFDNCNFGYFYTFFVNKTISISKRTYKNFSTVDVFWFIFNNSSRY